MDCRSNTGPRTAGHRAGHDAETLSLVPADDLSPRADS
ncbi:hypothetical protein FHS96_002140 [Sphingomonas zeicaulis]